MDFDEIVVKDSPGLCRCCLSEGCYKDLSTDYTWMGENEIYADMLFECFDISITQHTEGPNGSSRLICEVCITRLRDACNFKKQVLESEKKFVDMVGRGDFKPKVIVLDTTPLKTEPLPGPSEDDCEIEYLDEDADYTDGYRDDEPLQKLQAAGITVSSLSVKGKRGKKRSAESTKPVKAEKKKKAESKASKLKSSKDEANSPFGKITQTTSLEDTRDNLKSLLNATNFIPFRYVGQQYQCFFCDETFLGMREMKSHFIAEHDGFTTPGILRKVLPLNKQCMVKIEISDLNCKVCRDNFDSYESIIDHIVTAHKERYNRKVDDNFLKFRLNDDDGFPCLLCEFKGKHLFSLITHTHSEHNKNKIICDTCGKPYATEATLQNHIKSAHEKRVLKCKHCEASFYTFQDRRAHDIKVHKINEFTCDICQKQFSSAYLKKRHLIIAHKQTPFKCKFCDKIFVYKHYLISHEDTVHLKERMPCVICGERFTKYYMKAHMLCHTEERPFQCNICNRAFARKKNLIVHKRSHERKL